MKIGAHPGDEAVDLLGKRLELVEGAQARLDVAHLHPGIGRRDGRRHGRRRIALHQHPIGPLGGKNRLELGHHPGEHLGGRLAGAHDIEIVVHLDAEQLEHLIEHVAMLSGDADPRLDTGLGPQRRHHRSHLDRLGTGAEDRKNLHRWSQSLL